MPAVQKLFRSPTSVLRRPIRRNLNPQAKPLIVREKSKTSRQRLHERTASLSMEVARPPGKGLLLKETRDAEISNGKAKRKMRHCQKHQLSQSSQRKHPNLKLASRNLSQLESPNAPKLSQ